jgi:steroid delta-isomerase-like uncharacterized protein
MSEQNKMLVRRAYEEVYNQGKLEVIDELVTDDFVVHVGAEDLHGPVALKEYVTMLRGGFPDLHLTIDMQVADGDIVVTRWTGRGTHTGTFQGIPPTGRQGSMTGIDIDRIRDGRTVECWTNTDDLGLLQQLGVLPAPEQVAR